MKSIAVAVVMLVGAAFLGSSAWAQSGSPEIASGKIVNLNGSISGTAQNSASGACTGGTKAFADQCPNGHTCVCTQIPDANFSSSVIGKGKANIFVTVDTTAGFGLPTPSTSPSPECFPFVGEIDLIAKNDTESLEGTGAECGALPKNSQLAGAFAIASSNLLSGGYANFTVSLNNNNGNFKMTFKGQAKTN